MSVKLRLRRLGRKSSPFYHIVAADARSPRDGKFLEKIGSYNPTRDPAAITLDNEKALNWLKNGAQPTKTVKGILRYTGVNLQYALHKQGKDPEVAEAIFSKWKAEKDAKIAAKIESISSKKETAAKERFERESKIRESIASKIAARNAPPAEEVEASKEEAATTEEEVEEVKSPLDEAKEDLKDA